MNETLDTLLPWLVTVLIAAAVFAFIYFAYDNNLREWEQARECDRKGGVMITYPGSGCAKVNIAPIQQ